MKLTVLGSGTSHGIPVIGCDCPVCKSTDIKDKRYRSSVYIETDEGKFILVDIGPEFRIQALENDVRKVDALLLTHSHADHLHGIDDLRIFSASMYKKPEHQKSLEQYNAPPIPIYTNKITLDDITTRFAYFFKDVKEGGGIAKVSLHEALDSFDFYGTKITPVPMMHGHLPTTGWLFSHKKKDGNIHSIAYLTDCSFIEDSSINLILENCGILDHLIIDGLRVKEHSTHFSFLQAMGIADRLKPLKVWMTHITHENTHVQITEYLKIHKAEFENLKNIEVLPAYDRLIIES
ncbi:MAG: MBL fold metallo-hydrolase [Treponema sp.]|nr:MBL fold metallo-hydrolase [Treponema sp.]